MLNGRSYFDYYKFSYNTDNPILYSYQNYLYALFMSSQPIQSLSVVEGTYTATNNITVGSKSDASLMNSVSDSGIIDTVDMGRFDVTSRLKLLDSTDRDKSYAFSNRLFEGLLHHTINRQDENYHNIVRV